MENLRTGHLVYNLFIWQLSLELGLLKDMETGIGETIPLPQTLRLFM